MVQEGRDLLSRLPDDLLVHIFSFTAQPTTLAKYSIVCKRWNKVASSDYLWTGLVDVLPLPDDMYKKVYRPPPTGMKYYYFFLQYALKKNRRKPFKKIRVSFRTFLYRVLPQTIHVGIMYYTTRGILRKLIRILRLFAELFLQLFRLSRICFTYLCGRFGPTNLSIELSPDSLSLVFDSSTNRSEIPILQSANRPESTAATMTSSIRQSIYDTAIHNRWLSFMIGGSGSGDAAPHPTTTVEHNIGAYKSSDHRLAKTVVSKDCVHLYDDGDDDDHQHWRQSGSESDGEEYCNTLYAHSNNSYGALYDPDDDEGEDDYVAEEYEEADMISMDDANDDSLDFADFLI